LSSLSTPYVDCVDTRRVVTARRSEDPVEPDIALKHSYVEGARAGDDIEVELLAADSQFESGELFDALESRKLMHVIPWRRLKNRVNPPDVLSVKNRIDVEGPEYLRSVYHRLRSPNEGLFGRAKCRLNLSGFTWQGLDNVHIHVCLALSMAYGVCIVAHRIGRPELRQSVAYFA
jgi:hypothetical protein